MISAAFCRRLTVTSTTFVVCRCLGLTEVPWMTRVSSTPMTSVGRALLLVVATSALSACATPARMHDEAQLNNVALGCGLALGELIQDEAEKKLLLMVRQDASVEQRVCVSRWARRNGLKAVFVNMNFPAG